MKTKWKKVYLELKTRLVGKHMNMPCVESVQELTLLPVYMRKVTEAEELRNEIHTKLRKSMCL